MMRDRLIELLKKAKITEIYRTSDGEPVTSIDRRIVDFGEVNILAEYLLANGVIVPPCKVGDVVYVIEPCTCYNNYREPNECHRRRTKATKWIDIVRVPKKHYTKCLKLFERPFKIEYLNKFGKTVFLTREDAEQALKGDAEK